MLLHLHLISDSTGETLESIARACLSQFESVEVVRHFWPMVRSVSQIEKILQDVCKKPGLVLFSMVNRDQYKYLKQQCALFNIPAISVLDPVLDMLTQIVGEKVKGKPGQQYTMDQLYYKRLDAIKFTITHDDGQALEDLDDADIVLLGVSRISKTPTSIYLANRGYKTMNVPLVQELGLSEILKDYWGNERSKPFIVGLLTSSTRLMQVRKSRILGADEKQSHDYTDIDVIKRELLFAKRIYEEMDWPQLDTTRKSIEETAAGIIEMQKKNSLLYSD